MNRLFLSYRTDDSVHATMAISDRLAHHFGRANVFRDHDSLRLGMVYPRRIRRALEMSDIVLAVIGPHWLDARDGRGRRRIDSPRDWVRTELRMAFEREIPVVPVLLDQTPLPTNEQLPDDIRLLALSNFCQIRHQTLAADIGHLVARLDAARPGPAAPDPAAPAKIQHTFVSGGVAYVNQDGHQTINLDGSGRDRR